MFNPNAKNYCDPNLVLDQESLSFEFEEYRITLRVIHPAKTHGCWPGNSMTIREWVIHKKGDDKPYERCSQNEVKKFEKMIGNDSEKIIFANHESLGEIAFYQDE